MRSFIKIGPKMNQFAPKTPFLMAFRKKGEICSAKTSHGAVNGSNRPQN